MESAPRKDKNMARTTVAELETRFESMERKVNALATQQNILGNIVVAKARNARRSAPSISAEGVTQEASSTGPICAKCTHWESGTKIEVRHVSVAAVKLCNGV